MLLLSFQFFISFTNISIFFPAGFSGPFECELFNEYFIRRLYPWGGRSTILDIDWYQYNITTLNFASLFGSVVSKRKESAVEKGLNGFYINDELFIDFVCERAEQ